LKEHRLGQHPKQHRLSILHHQTSGLKKLELDEEQIEKSDQNCHNQGQPIASPDEHTKCKNRKRNYKSGRANSHLPFVGAGKNVAT
jgi:hypothetical protein